MSEPLKLIIEGAYEVTMQTFMWGYLLIESTRQILALDHFGDREREREQG